MSRVYLDHNATTALRREARDAMVAAMECIGNPSSVHAEGRQAKGIIERARSQVAALVDAGDADIVFLSGATEAATMACAPYAETRGGGASLVAADVEHDCVLAWQGTRHPLAVDASGRIDFDGLRGNWGGDTGQVAVAVQAANSETGVLQDVAQAAAALDGQVPRPVLITDAVQVLGKAAWSFERSRADMALVSAHKFGGPKGVGALVVRRGLDLPSLLRGGGQEMGRRAGTENVAAIAGFGAAAASAERDLAAGRWEEIAELRNILEKALEAGANATIFVGNSAPRLPNTSCFITAGWKGEKQVIQMDLAGFAISAGSACSSGKVRASRVLRAMGYDDEAAASAVRVSLGLETTRADVLRFADTWLAKERKFRARAA